MIKISHESPLCMLEESRLYNDYSYALVHLFEEQPGYLNFFKEEVQRGRHVLLDNSIFELKKAFDSERYLYWIKELSPTEYIIPDSLENTDETVRLARDWYINYQPQVDDIKTIGVVQGKTYKELVMCYKEMDKLFDVDKIAISFDYSYYLSVFPYPNKWVSYMMGRVITLNKLFDDGVINPHKPHHLLGNATPREFSFYNIPKFNWIESLDTSSPIVHGFKKIGYGEKISTWEKERTKLIEYMNEVPDEEQRQYIRENIIHFRKMVLNG